MRASPAAFKRRRLFTSFTPAAPHPPGPEGDDTRSLALLDAELQAARVALECCVVGGAVLRLCFSLGTESRRPSALIGHPAVAARAVTAVADQEGLEESWLDAAAREVVQADPTRHYEGVALRVLAPPPDYALAFLCALLRYRPDAATERDVRYLARYLGLSTGGEVARTVDAYLGPRQRPADLDYRVDRWLA